MKQYLQKRWLGVPAALIIAVSLVVLIAGGALAVGGAFNVITWETDVDVLEPLVVTEIQEPGWFWDWGNPDEPAVEQEVYAGMNLGDTGIGGKYFILNLMPSENPRGQAIPTQYISVTVTVTETTGQMEWYGLGIYPASGWHATDSANWNDPFITSDVGSYVYTYTFDMGNKAYPGNNVTPSADILQDSNQISIFVQGKVADNAAFPSELNFIVTVDRGS